MNAVQHIVRIKQRASDTVTKKTIALFFGLRSQIMENRPVQLDGIKRRLRRLTQHLNQVKTLCLVPGVGAKDLFATERFQVMHFVFEQ